MRNADKKDLVFIAAAQVIAIACKKYKVEIVEGKDPLQLWHEAVNKMSTNLLNKLATHYREDDTGLMRQMGLVVKARLSELNQNKKATSAPTLIAK